MRIVVCIKPVPDSEAPASVFSVENVNKVVIADYIPWLIGPYEESAIEAALQLKDRHDCEVILLCLGSSAHQEKIIEALATGADRAVWIVHEENSRIDSFGTAYALAEAIRAIGDVDLVLCGRQAADTDSGIVGPALAALLRCASIAVARKVDFDEEKLIVHQQAGDDIQVLEVSLPAVISVTSENYTLRYASLANIMTAMGKDFKLWELSDLGLSNDLLREEYSMTTCIRAEVLDPIVTCKIIAGHDEEELVSNLLSELRMISIFK